MSESWTPYLTADRGRVQAHAPGVESLDMTEAEAVRRIIDYEKARMDLAEVVVENSRLAALAQSRLDDKSTLAAELARVRGQRDAIANAADSLLAAAAFGPLADHDFSALRAALDACKE
jgi:hypothetical protein